MILQLVIEHVKSIRLDVPTAIETFPRLELTEGKSEVRRENVVMSVYLLGFSIGWFSRT